MKHLVFLDPHAGELEKILSVAKTMLIKELDLMRSTVPPVMSGDSLYFLLDNAECAVRVTARVVRIFPFLEIAGDDLSQVLKELQPRLQLTEDQYNDLSAQCQALLVEFESARKIPVIAVALNRVKDRSGWLVFEAFCLIT